MSYPMWEIFNSPVKKDFTLFYDEVINRLKTEDGTIIMPCELGVENWQLDAAKAIGMLEGYAIIVPKTGKVIEIYFSDKFCEEIEFDKIKAYDAEMLELYRSKVTVF